MNQSLFGLDFFLYFCLYMIQVIFLTSANLLNGGLGVIHCSGRQTQYTIGITHYIMHILTIYVQYSADQAI